MFSWIVVYNYMASLVFNYQFVITLERDAPNP